MIFHDSSATSPTRGWTRTRITAVGTRRASIGCPVSTGFTTAADATRSVYDITTPLPIPTNTVRGAPVRFIRHGQYSIYRASDNQWYLGYRRCNALDNLCSVVQPLSGPYETSSGPPFTFRYFMSSGVPWTGVLPTTAITRVDLVAHAATSTLQIPGLPRAIWRDSALASIAIRNIQ